MAGRLNRKLFLVGLLAAAGVAGALACSSMGSSNSGSETAAPGGGYDVSVGGAGNQNPNNGYAAATGGTTLPPETKVQLVVEVPQASPKYVYAANPDRDSVAVIDPGDLSIQTVAVDSAPHGLKTVANQDAAIVVNTGAGSISVLRTANKVTTVTTEKVMSGSNVASVAPNGQYAVIYYDSSQPTDGPPTDSPQNVSVADLSSSSAVNVYQVTVGYHPTAVSYSDDSSKAFVVSDDGVSKIDLTSVASVKSRVAELVHLYDATVTTAAAVTVTPDGAYAVAHQPNSTTVRLVDLAANNHRDLNLSSLLGSADAGAGSLDVSDVEMSPDGTFLLAVVRNQKVALRVPIPDGFEDPSEVDQIDLPNVLTGVAQIGPSSHYAVLYTTVDSQNEQRVTIVDLKSNNAPRVVNLHKIVHAVTFDPTGNRAFILHQKSNIPTSNPPTQDQITANSYAYSVIDLATGTPKLQLTQSQPGPIAALPDGSALFVLFNPTNPPWEVQRMDLLGFSVDHVGIGSLPTGIGFVELAKKVFVSQQHVDGRMTFINWTDLKVTSVTGYELNSGIWE
jgi:hypothetical protein